MQIVDNDTNFIKFITTMMTREKCRCSLSCFRFYDVDDNGTIEQT